MSLETELKRRLEVHDQPLAKKLRLAENIISSSFFPVINKDEVILEWIFAQISKSIEEDDRKKNFISLKNCFSKPINYKNFSNNFKSKLFTVLSEFLKEKTVDKEIVIETCLYFLENPTIGSYIQQFINEYFTFQTLLLTEILEGCRKNDKDDKYESYAKRSLTDISNFMKNFGKKSVLVEAFIDCKTLKIVLELTKDTRFNYKALSICQSVLFPKSTIQIYRSYLGALIKGISLKSLIEEKGESLRSVVKVLDVLFKYNPSDESGCDYLNDFIKLFVFCCKNEEIVVYFFVILLTKCIGLEQEHVEIFGSVSQVNLSRDDIEGIYYNIISLLSEYNFNLNLTFSNDANNENEKSFMTFLQQTIFGLLHNGSINKTLLLIMQSSILLDPVIFEPLVENVLPKLCITSKSDDIMQTYNSLMLTILNIQFKLSRGTEFIPRIVPHLKRELESIDQEQSELISKLKSSDNKKYLKKIRNRETIFTNDFCLLFGKLSSELMSWQNVIILNSLSDLLDKFCITDLASENTAPSVILMTELLCSLLNCFFLYTKMADQSLTHNIVTKFVDALEPFEEKLLGRFGRCLTSVEETRVIFTFLDLCYMYGQFKLLLSRYQPYYKCPFVDDDGSVSSEKKVKKIGDFSMLHSYLSGSQWKDLFNKVKTQNDPICNNAVNRLVIQKLIMLDVCDNNENIGKLRSFVKTYVFDNLESFWSVLMEEPNGKILLANMTSEEINLFSNKIVTMFLNDESEFDKQRLEVFMRKDFIKNEKNILSEFVLDVSRLLWTIFESQKNLKDYKSLVEASHSNDFDIRIFFKENIIDVREYLRNLSESKIFKKFNNVQKIQNVLEFISLMAVENLPDKYQYMVLFNIVTLKCSLHIDNMQDNVDSIRNVDSAMEFILFKMYELSYKVPNAIELFPFDVMVENVFCLIDDNRRKSRNHNMIVKMFYERLLTKDYFNQLKGVVKCLKKELTSMDSKSSEEKIMSVYTQMITLLYTTLTNFKKTALPSDMKAVIVKAINDSREGILNLLDSIKWKSLSIRDEKLETSQSDVNESMEVIENRPSLEMASMNICECYSLLLQNKLESKDEADAKILKSLKKGLKNFVTLANNNLPDPEICLQHAKGGSILLNNILKHMSQFESDKFLNDQQSYLMNTFQVILAYIQNNNKRHGQQWGDVLTVNLESVKLVFELSDEKVFSNLVSKYCSVDFSVHNKDDPNASHNNTMNITKLLWTCLMNANLKSQNKNDIRVNVLKELLESYRAICRDQAESEVKRELDDKEDNSKSDGNIKNEVVVSNSKNIMEKIAVCFQVACQFVSMKKIPLASTVIDSIIQMPMLLSVETSNEQSSLEVFKEKFDLSANLINSLLIHRSELIQDRWPCFLQGYRKIMKCLCIRSNSDKLTDKEDIETFISMAMTMERITQSMAKKEKQELTRISSYLIADIINYYHKIPVLPEVKFHIEKCVYSLFDLLDSHSIGFLMRNLQDSQRLIFQQIHQSYNRYYKYTGMS